MGRVIASIAVFATLLAAPASQAATVPPALFSSSQQQLLSSSLPIARAAWPGSPCSGREVIELDQDVGLEHTHGAGFAGDASTDGLCVVRMSHISGRVDFCSTLVHELGHLSLGPFAFAAVNPRDPPHSPDPTNIMSADGLTWLGCVPRCPWGQTGARCAAALNQIAGWFPAGTGSPVPPYLRKITVRRAGPGYTLRFYMRSGRVVTYLAPQDWSRTTLPAESRTTKRRPGAPAVGAPGRGAAGSG